MILTIWLNYKSSGFIYLFKRDDKLCKRVILSYLCVLYGNSRVYHGKVKIWRLEFIILGIELDV